MRIRKCIESNYKSIFTDDFKTLRYKIDQNLPILKIKFPELEDVSINNLCYHACSYCYTNAKRSGKNFEDVLKKINEIYGPLNENRPYQVAIGGAGEPSLHNEFCDVIKEFYQLNIVPNYTTSGMYLTDRILEYTKKYCGGVAISTHDHLNYHVGINKLVKSGIKTNLHIIVGQHGTCQKVIELYNKYKNDIYTYVILPYAAHGRAKEINKDVFKNEIVNLVNFINTIDKNKFAFGALLYPFIKDNEDLFSELSLYEPELFSGYRLLDEDLTLKKSSYDLTNRG